MAQISNNNLAQIPYQGSKATIADFIVSTIRQRHPKADTFCDLFGGGGAISFVALKHFKHVIYNDLDTQIYNLVKFFTDGNKVPAEWWRWRTREEFMQRRNLTDPESALVAVVWSFGNDRNSYLYSVEKARNKEMLHKLVVGESDDYAEASRRAGFDIKPLEPAEIALEYFHARRMHLRRQVLQYEKRCDLESLQRLQSLESLQRLETFNLSYDEVPIPPNSVIYCDIPYGKGKDYKVAFDRQKFIDWAENHTLPVYVSEYNL